MADEKTTSKSTSNDGDDEAKTPTHADKYKQYEADRQRLAEEHADPRKPVA